MSAQSSRFAMLIDLAKASTSEKRRELLREVTDLFFETEETRNARESALLDEVLKAVAVNMEESVLAELATRFAEAEIAPLGLMRDLATRPISVAEIVLRRCRALTDDDLMRVIELKGQEHMRAVASRDVVSERLSEAIVRRGDDSTLRTLLGNSGARMSRDTMETVVDRARENASLHEAVVFRADLPIDLLNELYFVVEQKLRGEILNRNAAMDPAELDAALARTRARVKRSFEAMSADLHKAESFIQSRKAAGQLTPSFVVQLYRDSRLNEFLFALCELTSVEFDTLRDVIGRRDLDALATICRAADVERPLFVTLAVLVCGGEQAIGKAEEYGRLYSEVPVEAARRAVRFFKVRRGAASAVH